MIDLSTITHIWNIIVKSNTFNFIIFVLILAWIFKKIDVKGMISSLQIKILEMIEAAKKTKEEAKGQLLNAEKAVENLGQELKVIIDDATRSAEIVSEKILSEAEKQIANIENNAKKVIEAEEKLLIAKLTQSTSKASVEAAKSHITNVLRQAPTLHEKYIDESINELDRLSF